MTPIAATEYHHGVSVHGLLAGAFARMAEGVLRALRLCEAAAAKR
jgi:hypothetical protein